MFHAIREAGIDRFAAEMEIRFARVPHGPAANLVGKIQQAGLVGDGWVRLCRNETPRRCRRDRGLLIARALLHQPKVLFLDEPTRGLDPRVARDIRSMVAELATDGVTIFLTTHYMEEADKLSDRVAIIDQGQIDLS